MFRYLLSLEDRNSYVVAVDLIDVKLISLDVVWDYLEYHEPSIRVFIDSVLERELGMTRCIGFFLRYELNHFLEG